MGSSSDPIKELINKAIKHAEKKEDNLMQVYGLHPWALGWEKH